MLSQACGRSVEVLGNHSGTGGESPTRPLQSLTLEEMKAAVIAGHYAHTWPSGKTWAYDYEGAIVVFSIPANKNISKWLVGESNRVLELTRLWAPDGHRFNLLTEAISYAVSRLRMDASQYTALISYADPNVQEVAGVEKPSHVGNIYRAASWAYMGQSEEGRFFRDPRTGQILARRAFSDGAPEGATTRAGKPRKFRTDAEIVAQGYIKERLPGKHRYARGLTKQTRKLIARHNAVAIPKGNGISGTHQQKECAT